MWHGLTTNYIKVEAACMLEAEHLEQEQSKWGEEIRERDVRSHTVLGQLMLIGDDNDKH